MRQDDIREVLHEAEDPEDRGLLARLNEVEECDSDEMCRRAAEDGLELTDEHLEVLCFLRKHYVRHGPARSATELTRLLSRQFAERGGRRYLYNLFPRGPILQASWIAGVPLPEGTVDRSFGSVH